MNKIFLNISDIASFIGQNKWDYITPFERLWKKYDIEYHTLLNEYNNKISIEKITLLNLEHDKQIIEDDLLNKKITKRQYTKLLKENTAKIDILTQNINDLQTTIENISLSQIEKIEKNLGKDIITTITSSETETNDKRKITNNVIEELEKTGKIKQEQKEELLKQTESFINKTHGTLKEDSAIKIFEQQYNVILDTSQKYYKHLVKETQNHTWYIGGKMDGIYIDEHNPDNNYIVEVKNRTKGFFNSLRDYEKTQIQLYLMLSGFKHAKLVEKFHSKIRVTDIEIEQNYITDLLDYINIFIHNIENRFWNNSQLKIEYFNMTENAKKQLLNKLYIEEILKLKKEKEELQILQNQTDNELLSDLDEL